MGELAETMPANADLGNPQVRRPSWGGAGGTRTEFYCCRSCSFAGAAVAKCCRLSDLSDGDLLSLFWRPEV